MCVNLQYTKETGKKGDGGKGEVKMDVDSRLNLAKRMCTWEPGSEQTELDQLDRSFGTWEKWERTPTPMANNEKAVRRREVKSKQDTDVAVTS